MNTATRWRGSVIARRVVTAAIATTMMFTGLGSVAAVAADEVPPDIEWSTSWTQQETVTVTETATIDGFTGRGEATATASATAIGTAKAKTNWEVYYFASLDAYNKASAAAKAKADAEARPIAKERAEADARAKAAAVPQLIEWSTSWTQQETVTVTETATIDGFTGRGEATATASATAIGTAKAKTNWEVYYFASLDAYNKASAAAKAKADAEARPIAKERAEADARAKAAAVPKVIEWSVPWTQEESVTVTETATIDGFDGYGTATATASATAIGSGSGASFWEAHYWAFQDAFKKASDEAKSKADAEARRIAKERAEADAQAQADAAAEEPDPEPEDPGPVDPGPVDPPPGPSCGAEVLKSDGTPWRCTFVDAFSGDSLNADKWVPVKTSETAFGSKDCFVGLGDNIRVEGGILRLTTQKEDAPVTCDHPTRPMTSDYTSGSVSSVTKFSQTYGRFEIRAAMPQTDGPGLHSALWLVPDEPTFYGGWPLSGEIDIVEYYSANPDRLIPALHYGSLTPWADRTNNHCLVHNPTSFHTYVLEWTANKLRVSIDGTTCVEHTINPLAPLLGGAPFDRPFNINLTQGLGILQNSLPEGKVVDQATLQIDYVRVWS